MTQIFGEKLDWKHVAIVVLVLAIAYFIWKHNGIQGAYHALLSDVDMGSGVKTVKGKHRQAAKAEWGINTKGTCGDLPNWVTCDDYTDARGTDCKDSFWWGCTTV